MNLLLKVFLLWPKKMVFIILSHRYKTTVVKIQTIKLLNIIKLCNFIFKRSRHLKGHFILPLILHHLWQ